MAVTIPNGNGIRWRYCSRWEEQPAAQLGKSLLRLGICRPEDWSGSAINFVERGFARLCKTHGAGRAAKIWDGNLRLMDCPFYVTELERNQARAEIDEPTNLLYLLGDYNSAASIPIGPTLRHLEVEHRRLPGAFYTVFVGNLCTWMRVYDYEDALRHAEILLEDVQEGLVILTNEVIAVTWPMVTSVPVFWLPLPSRSQSQ